MKEYVLRMLQETREYLASIPHDQVETKLNQLTPAPWGEMRPTYLNIVGGVIQHYLQHMMQVAVRKERIREKY